MTATTPITESQKVKFLNSAPQKLPLTISVIGCGNVGFNTLKAFHAKGFQVVGFDVSERARLRIREEIDSGIATDSLADVVKTDAAFICVPTDPLDATGECDLSILEDVARGIAAFETDDAYRLQLVVQRSTCPPGTAKKMSAIFNRTNYAVNPSFLCKHTQWEDTIRPVRIAIAGNELSLSLLREIYKPFSDTPFFESRLFEVVEMLKYVENVTDAVLISLWNEFLSISDRLQIPRSQFVNLIAGLVQRPRFGTTVRVPGQAFGLWCLPKDLAALIHEAERETALCNVMKGAEVTNKTLQQRAGIGNKAGGVLYGVEDGRVCLTEAGIAHLTGE